MGKKCEFSNFQVWETHLCKWFLFLPQTFPPSGGIYLLAFLSFFLICKKYKQQNTPNTIILHPVLWFLYCTVLIKVLYSWIGIKTQVTYPRSLLILKHLLNTSHVYIKVTGTCSLSPPLLVALEPYRSHNFTHVKESNLKQRRFQLLLFNYKRLQCLQQKS